MPPASAARTGAAARANASGSILAGIGPTAAASVLCLLIGFVVGQRMASEAVPCLPTASLSEAPPRLQARGAEEEAEDPAPRKRKGKKAKADAECPPAAACPVCPAAAACPPPPPAAACPACPAASPTGDAPLGLTYWRQTAYMMAPFVFPQVHACLKTEAELPPGDHHRSQSNEDRWLWDGYFSKLPREESWGGTFVELGAVDGNTFSNTMWFEKTRDWRGVLIEAHPSNSVVLRGNQGLRPNTAMFTAAVCGLTATGAPSTLGFTQGGGAVGAAVELANEKFLRGWHQGATTGTFPVDCIPLQAMLDAAGIADVDIFSLDVEGAELAVLQTIDWAVLNVRVLIVELDGDNPGKDEEVRKLLRGQGFVPTPWGRPKDACTPGADCTSNDAFLNERYMERKRARVAAGGTSGQPTSPFHPTFPLARYRPGTAVKCAA